MTKKLARLLRADIQETSDLKSIAKMLANKGRGGDTILAHITPKEVSLLKEAGGAGTINPDTGLLEFYDWSGGFETTDPTSSYQSAPSVDNYDYYQIAPEVSAPASSPAPTPAPVADSNQYYSDYYQIAPTGEAPTTPAAPAVVAPGYQQYSEYPVTPGAVSITQQGLPDTGAGGGGGADQRGFLQRFVGDPLTQLKTATGLGAADLLRVGGAGAGAVLGRKQAQQAAKQIQAATQEQKNLGQPYQEAGQNLRRAAEAGELTPQGAQAYQAMRAQMAQGVESRGGVGVAQAQAQVEAFRQQLLANQYNLGLQVSQIGDNIALGAIRTGMQLDQQLNQANQQFYTQLAAIAGGGTYGYNPQQVRGQ